MRLFAGIALPDSVRDACGRVQERLRPQLRAHFEEAIDLHVTLAFLGQVDDTRLPELASALARTASGVPPFDLLLDRIGAFPNERRPRVVWIGSRAQNRYYRALALRARETFGACGFVFEGDPVVHVTIARIKGGGRRPVPLLEVAPIVFHIGQIALLESLRVRAAARYAVRAIAPLK